MTDEERALIAYADMVVFKADEVAGWLAQTETFVSHIESLISDAG